MAATPVATDRNRETVGPKVDDFEHRKVNGSPGGDVKTSTALQILTESMVVHLHGDTAIVSGSFRTKGIERGRPYGRRERFVDTWLYKNERWVSITTMVTFAGD